MSDSGLSDIGINFFIDGLMRYRTRGLSSDKFLSDIGPGCIGVGYRISATKLFDVAPTYEYIIRKSRMYMSCCYCIIVNSGSLRCFSQTLSNQSSVFHSTKIITTHVYVSAPSEGVVKCFLMLH
jgi:hypothetical protein